MLFKNMILLVLYSYLICRILEQQKRRKKKTFANKTIYLKHTLYLLVVLLCNIESIIRRYLLLREIASYKDILIYLHIFHLSKVLLHVRSG